ncbi:hypothetical protein PGB90_003961 [Kerria lacca]
MCCQKSKIFEIYGCDLLNAAEGTGIEKECIKPLKAEKVHSITKSKVQEDVLHCDQNSKFVVLSISIEPILSLAERFNLSPQETIFKISGYFKEKGVHAVHTTTIAEEFALLETTSEFIYRYTNKKNGFRSSLPMLASACPGWICYAEKTHGFLLPFISTTKSPQQIMGSLLKLYYAKEKNIEPGNIYHISLMPCYDKKLEASRADFYNADLNVKDVDCVITAVEVELLLQKEVINFCEIKSQSLNYFKDLDITLQEHLSVHFESLAGVYAYYIAINAAKELFHIDIRNTQLKSIEKNQDLKEIIFQNDDKTLNFAVINGFRNIQNMIQKIKRNKCSYDYVEIMACPSGCINGSAQIKSREGSSSKELILKLESLYSQLPKRITTDRISANKLFKDWLNRNFKCNVEAILHTSYHVVPKNVFPLNIKW